MSVATLPAAQPMKAIVYGFLVEHGDMDNQWMSACVGELLDPDGMATDALERRINRALYQLESEELITLDRDYGLIEVL